MKVNVKLKFNPNTKIRGAFILTVGIILFVAVFIVGLTAYILFSTGALTPEKLVKPGFWIVLIFVAASFILGISLSAIASRLLLKPINTLIGGMTRLSSGDYSVRIDLGEYQAMKQLADGFNSLAEELGNTEILRSDFINNFSHEFKTPIVSIRGLIGLLKKGNVSEVKRIEYLEIIEDETARLSQMATNVLNLTKIESQSILTDVTEFNISEQIRTCILLLEKEWSKKKLDFKLDFDEINAYGNEDLLKQVWLNLLDNAVKFADDGSELAVDIWHDKDGLAIAIKNHGATISEDEREKIFAKFYQIDRSSTRSGNGIGLSIVKHIIDLHGGEIKVDSLDGVTTFTVILPEC